MQPASQALTVVIPITAGRRESLEQLLAAIQAGVGGKQRPVTDRFPVDDILRPSDLPHTHFTRFLILDDTAAVEEQGGGPPFPSLFIWESNHDGTRADYLRAIAVDAVRRRWFDVLFSHCDGWKGASFHQLFDFCRRHAVRAEAFYSAYRGEPRERTLNDRHVYAAACAFVDDNRDELVRLAPRDVRERVREHLMAEHLHLDLTRTEDPARAFRAQWWALAGTLIVLSPLLLALLWLAQRALRSRERTDPVKETNAPVHHRHHIENEDKIRQNQLTHVVDIKPGWLRFWVLRGILFVVDIQARTRYTKGHLRGIRTIHFARWVILKDKRATVARAKRRHRLLFFSNYDFSWDAYLGEFIDRAARGLTGVWSNTNKFPRTEGIIHKGAADEEAFKQWARSCQTRTHVWWSGYPDSTVDNVRTHLFVRRYLTGDAPSGGMEEWLRRL